MKWLSAISFLLLFHPVFSQDDPASLAKKITASYQTEKEKVTAIFKWITSNITYRVKPSPHKIIGKSSLKNFEREVEDNSPLKPLSERVAETVLQRRVAVCDGYARLFTTLCDYAGINSAVIVGYARAGTNKPTKRGINHYWNAVMIDGSWYLLDATWASGYLSRNGDEFIQDYDGKYFLTPPGVFIQDHYPDDARWTLLPDTEVPEEFRKSPFKQKSFTKYNITSYYPATGVIETFIGDTIRLKLETSLTEWGRNVCPDLLIDSAIFTHSPSWVFLKPHQLNSQNEYNYIYTVVSPAVEWLYLIYNDDLVLRYKVNVKKKKV